MQNAIKLENISNLITLTSSYECRKARLVHFVMHGRHTSMECMCEYWGSLKVHFQNKWKQKLSYRIIRIKRIFPEFIDMYRYGLSSMLLFALWFLICCQFLLIVPLFLIISSLRFIEKDCETNNPNNLNTMIKLGYGCLFLRVLYIKIKMTSRDVWKQVFDTQLYISILHFPCHNILWQCTKFIVQS